MSKIGKRQRRGINRSIEAAIATRPLGSFSQQGH
jgi:hypothetical protein